MTRLLPAMDTSWRYENEGKDKMASSKDEEEGGDKAPRCCCDCAQDEFVCKNFSLETDDPTVFVSSQVGHTSEWNPPDTWHTSDVILTPKQR